MAKILIIDDDPLVRNTLKAVLAAAGHQIVVAHDGQMGIDMLAEAAPDLVITDILMPNKDGIATITELHQRRPGVPIVAISGGGRVGNMSYLKIAESLGVSRTFDKPFDPEELIDAIAGLLQPAA